jgi:hypothetical protein
MTFPEMLLCRSFGICSWLDMCKRSIRVPFHVRRASAKPSQLTARLTYPFMSRATGQVQRWCCTKPIGLRRGGGTVVSGRESRSCWLHSLDARNAAFLFDLSEAPEPNLRFLRLPARGCTSEEKLCRNSHSISQSKWRLLWKASSRLSWMEYAQSLNASELPEMRLALCRL